MEDNDYEQWDGEVYTGNYQKELDIAFKKMSEEEQLRVWDKAIIDQAKWESK